MLPEYSPSRISVVILSYAMWFLLSLILRNLLGCRFPLHFLYIIEKQNSKITLAVFFVRNNNFNSFPKPAWLAQLLRSHPRA